MARPLKFPKVVGTRLSREDGLKIQHLCLTLERTPGEVLRLLVRLAQPTDVAPVRFEREEVSYEREGVTM
jgi:hypothetical protein